MRWVGDWIDREVDGVGVAAALAITDRVGEAVRSMVVGIRCVDVAAICVDRDAAMGGTGGERIADRIAIRISGARQVGVEGAVFVERLRIIRRDRWVVDRIDREVDGVGVAAALTITDGVLDKN